MKVLCEKFRASLHPDCIVCSQRNSRGFGLVYDVCNDGSVQAIFDNCGQFEGYANLLHGGVISSLLDGAMTNCMFAHGFVTVTAQLKIRFRHSVSSNRPAIVRAWIFRSSPPLHILQSEILQDDQLKVTATGKFMEKPQLLSDLKTVTQ